LTNNHVHGIADKIGQKLESDVEVRAQKEGSLTLQDLESLNKKVDKYREIAKKGLEFEGEKRKDLGDGAGGLDGLRKAIVG
jgi:hypothetical protein